MITETQAKHSLELVASLLVKNGKVSFLEIFGEYGVRGLAQRIKELREIGFNIATFSVRGDCIYELIKAPKEYEKLIAQYRINLAKKRKIRKEFLSA